ncbi:hypothetical protein TNCV_1715331 [Trichonephila clavipes]|nr:hypothetical protein TNCV_1715331 [Trichonephila clavipes]
MPKLKEVEIGIVAIYRPFGEFCRANSYSHLAWVRIPENAWKEKCIVPLLHGGTLNGRRVVCLLVRMVEEEESWAVPESPYGVLPQN